MKTQIHRHVIDMKIRGRERPCPRSSGPNCIKIFFYQIFFLFLEKSLDCLYLSNESLLMIEFQPSKMKLVDFFTLKLGDKTTRNKLCLDWILRNFKIFIFKPNLSFLRKNHKNDIQDEFPDFYAGFSPYVWFWKFFT